MTKKSQKEVFDVCIDSKSFSRKPSAREIGGISNRIVNYPKQLTLQELASEIESGKSYLPCKLKDGTKRSKDNWERQNLLVLDIDEGMTLKEAFEHKFIRSNASFLHPTFSHTTETNKFRIIFALNHEVNDIDEYEKIMNWLFEKVPQADRACKDRARLFFAGEKVYWINEENRVNVDEILGESLKGDRKEYLNISPQPLSPIPSIKPQSTLNKSTQIEAIKSKDVTTLHSILNPNEIVLNRSAVEDYLKKIPSHMYLGIESYNSFHDVLHDEQNPSASIYESNKNNGHWLYKCFSYSNEFSGTIIEVTMQLQGCSRKEAIKFLMEVFKIKLKNGMAIKYFAGLYDYYLEYMSGNNLAYQYPDLYKLLTRSKALGLLVELLVFVRENINESGTQIECYYALDTLSKELGCSKSQLSKKINLFTLLGFCEKANDDEIEEGLLKSLKNNQKKSKRKYRSTVYKFDVLGVELLEKANKIAKVFSGSNLTLNSMSYEGIGRSFGVEFANKIYPQDLDREIPEEHDINVMEFVKVIAELIEQKGWTTQQEVIERVNFGKRISKTKKTDIFKIAIKQILDDYDLEYVQLTKDMKLEMKIDETILSKSSFPKIIRKRIS